MAISGRHPWGSCTSRGSSNRCHNRNNTSSSSLLLALLLAALLTSCLALPCKYFVFTSYHRERPETRLSHANFNSNSSYLSYCNCVIIIAIVVINLLYFAVVVVVVGGVLVIVVVVVAD